jgi:hypothetical protein
VHTNEHHDSTSRGGKPGREAVNRRASVSIVAKADNRGFSQLPIPLKNQVTALGLRDVRWILRAKAIERIVAQLEND